MSKVSITRSKLDNLAVAVSEKSGATLPLTIAQMQSAVESIPPQATLQSKTVSYTPTASQQTETVQADSGYDGLSSVSVTVNAMPSGTAGTPTATKGTVSNHSVSVTPSVTNTTGYITGSTKTGTAVTVSASELVSGSETKTANGTYDVTNLAELIVNVSGGGGGGDYPWFGPNTIKDYSKTITINLADDTSWDSWTASTTATSILAAPTTNDFTYSYNRETDSVWIICTSVTNYTLKSTATKTVIPISTARLDLWIGFGIPSTYARYKSLDVGNNSNKAMYDTKLYYYDSSGTKSATSSLYGVYLYGAPTYSQSASGSTVTISAKRNAIYARCISNYFAVGRKADIDAENTNIVITFDVYKTPRTGSFVVHGVNDMLTAMNAAPEA